MGWKWPEIYIPVRDTWRYYLGPRERPRREGRASRHRVHHMQMATEGLISNRNFIIILLHCHIIILLYINIITQ